MEGIYILKHALTKGVMFVPEWLLERKNNRVFVVKYQLWFEPKEYANTLEEATVRFEGIQLAHIDRLRWEISETRLKTFSEALTKEFEL